MRYYRIPFFHKSFYPGSVTRMNVKEKRIYLTFDDGPVPGITPAVADICSDNNIAATFFFTGINVERNRDEFRYVSGKGFGIGNHGYQHLNGRKSSFGRYVDDVRKGARVTGSDIFRPPYGALSRRQYISLVKEFRIVFWDLMPYDFDESIDNKHLLRIIERKTRNGSVIVLHDNQGSRLPAILGSAIGLLKEKGFLFGDLALALGQKQ